MSCGCIDSTEGEACDFVDTTTVKARKAHACDECHGPILAGDLYERASMKCDGNLLTQKTCLICVEIRGAFFCGSWTYGLIWEDIRAYFREGGSALGCIDELTTVAAKEKWTAAYRDTNGLDEPRAGGTPT